ncbi:LysR family transcriptional regulator [Pseudomonas sp. SWRI92]|uniref:LysR family transcriptional regulator n=1 Tax=Pseudomonas sp. SWRI92 TaxID=2745499 RepID=UPI001645FD5B|nr:LysR family transcriptional regulator [Pseudomonas sp. SWRI92]MBC3374089.1 LysR family transcriptional regulator [Pseudomonas sp. SWRI92]
MLISNQLRKLDMQDLMVFVAVYEQGNVTKVSEALCVSQSTVSYCLKKLRISFEDELFINTRSGMCPTHKAAAMYGQILEILKTINQCHVGKQAFDPSQAAVTFTVCAPEYFELLILPKLVKRFIGSSFPVVINITKFQRDIPVGALEEDRFDLVVCFGPNFHGDSQGLHSQTLLEDELMCVVDKHFSGPNEALSLEDFVACKHIFPTPWTSDTNMIDGWLDRQGHRRQIVARANSYVAALNLVAGTDFILTLPKRIQALLCDKEKFAERQPPAGLPNFTLDMVWNEKASQDSANIWLRQQIMQVCSEEGLR